MLKIKIKIVQVNYTNLKIFSHHISSSYSTTLVFLNSNAVAFFFVYGIAISILFSTSNNIPFISYLYDEQYILKITRKIITPYILDILKMISILPLLEIVLKNLFHNKKSFPEGPITLIEKTIHI